MTKQPRLRLTCRRSDSPRGSRRPPLNLSFPTLRELEIGPALSSATYWYCGIRNYWMKAEVFGLRVDLAYNGSPSKFHISREVFRKAIGLIKMLPGLPRLCGSRTLIIAFKALLTTCHKQARLLDFGALYKESSYRNLKSQQIFSTLFMLEL
eukprot:scaffold16066_cov109-Cylindrotheca_fusiformis.AAC.7